MRIARDIHDTLLQGLTAAVVQFDAVAHQIGIDPEKAKIRAQGTRQQIEHYIQDTRDAIYSLRHPGVQTLAKALRDTCENITASTDVNFTFVSEGTVLPYCPERDDELLKIGHEAVTNAVRHGQPADVRMELRYEPDRLILRVRDDGLGFVPSENDHGGWGLINMRERASQIGATLSITSVPNEGTVVEVVAHHG
jgi:signal transduction histidine kinase